MVKFLIGYGISFLVAMLFFYPMFKVASDADDKMEQYFKEEE